MQAAEGGGRGRRRATTRDSPGLEERGAQSDRRRRDGNESSEAGPESGAAGRRAHVVDGGRAGLCTAGFLVLLCSGLLGGGGFAATQAQPVVERADYDTNCGLGFAGLQCGEVQTCEELDYCSGHGICVRGGSCVCDVGWGGATCAQSNCPSGCSGHGTCAATGGCVCDAGYTGVICDLVECLGGGNCTGHGACLEGGVCVCEKGYLGGGCDVIDVAEKCSNHGRPDAAGDCACDLWFTGPDCSLALCLNNCSKHGACDATIGRCWCDPGWQTEDCSKQLCPNNCTDHGSCFSGACICQDGFSGDDCSIWPCPSACMGHGACFNGTCVCDRTWVGADCSVSEHLQIECPGNCTGSGICTNATCFCDPGWSGLDCASPIDCPGNCTSHGACVNATCACDLGFSGPDCATSHCLNNCTNAGACNFNGTCVCDPGRHGPDCSLSDLACAGAGNCSGHGACIDQAVTQWWSGSVRFPDLWALEAASLHLVRRDVGRPAANLGAERPVCIAELYGPPTGLEAVVAMNTAGEQRVLESSGVPDHFVSSPEFPLCEVAWRVSVPLYPERAAAPTPLPSDTAVLIAIALNGVPVWSANLADGSNAVEGPQAVACYGHASRSGMWHYHHPLFGCNAAATQEILLGYALDGFAIYGPLSGSKEEVDARLDPCNGRELEDGTYRYHVRTLAQVNGGRPHAASGQASNWNYVLGCFAGTPVTSLGLREVASPLRVASDAWIGGAAAGPNLELMNTATVAEQLGLSGRIGVCLCDPGWVGADCLVPGCLANCSGHGTCEGNLTLARCTCDVNWGGADCASAANTTCSNGCNGHGTCLWSDLANATCVCDAEWGGGGCEIPVAAPCDRNCSFHGSCFNKTCVCDPGFVGQDCEIEQLNLNATLCWQFISGVLVNNSCSGRGACFNRTCACDPGWVGANCSSQVTHIPERFDCLHNCSFHGACDFVWDSTYGSYNGTCLCDAGWTGPTCSLDWGSTQCAGNCTDHGSCINATCVCDPTWHGIDCMEKWVVPLCPMNCSDHGSCSNGTCTCDHGWLGDNCTLALPCPGDCSGNGVCDRGNCTCDPGFAGDDCSHTTVCPGYLADVGVNCSGHGQCINGNCSCELMWGGNDCSVQGCVNSCSRQGMCINGTCDCYVGYIGGDCSMGPYDGECPGSCSGNGACALVDTVPLPAGVSDIRRDGILEGTIGCVCDDGWKGPDCTLRACPEECNGNGACAQNGTCFCYRYWGAESCNEAACPDRCNDRGTCVGGQGCVCDVGYEGLDCGVSACPGNCSSNGVCLASPGDQYGNNLGEDGYEHAINATLARCLCFYGWGGEDCGQLACPMNCSYPRGQCNNGTCACDSQQGYFGHNCSEEFGAVVLRTDGRGLTPSYGIFRGGSTVTVRGTGFVSADTMRCKFGDVASQATLVQPTPPDLAYVYCKTPAVASPREVFFQFSIDGSYFTNTDSRIRFVYHGEGLITALQWPTGPVQGGTEVTFFGLNLQYAIGTKCQFGTYVVDGTFNTLFIEDPITQVQTLDGRLMCPVPALAALNLAVEASATVELFVSMDLGSNWMKFSTYPYFRYYAITHISPSFGPRQDQNTMVTVYGFNLFQGLSMTSIFPGFSYNYACLFYLPWLAEPVRVISDPSTWTLVTAPHTRAKFGCKAPPGLVGTGGYTGQVEVGASINPCLRSLADVDKTGNCIGVLPYARDPVNPVQFWYAETAITSLSVTVGPLTGGTTVTIGGVNFNRRDRAILPAGYLHASVVCSWGGTAYKSVGTYSNATNLVTCVSPACTSRECRLLTSAQCPNCAVPVFLEVALNGVDYSVTERQFSYFKDPNVLSVAPTLGPVLGGTRITITSEGFHDPCSGCAVAGSCAYCGDLVRCKFTAYDITTYSTAMCVRLANGKCDPVRMTCNTPYARDLRGNLVSLDPFFVAVSISINDQQFFPQNPLTLKPYNVFDTGKAFLFKFFETPRVSGVVPSASAGNGGGRITLTGVNFLNENTLRCHYGTKVGAAACSSGATGTFLPCTTSGCCKGTTTASAIFVSSSVVICPTIDLTGPDGFQPLQTRVGIALGGTLVGANDASFKVNTDNVVVEDALLLYWTTSLAPSIGFATGGTRITVAGVNFDALSPTGDNSKMRCKFANTIVAPDPAVIIDGRVQDPVEFAGGKILCTAPAVDMAGAATKVVSVGVCMIGVDCVYTGPAAQASTVIQTLPLIHHFTNNLVFQHYAIPMMQTITPSLGPQGGGTSITVRGIGFFDSPLLRCKYDLGHISSGSNVRFVSTTEVVCVTPPITRGEYGMELTFNGQQYAGGCGNTGICTFKSYEDPVITGVSPKGGITTGGTFLSINVLSSVSGYLGLKCKFKAQRSTDAARLASENLLLETAAVFSAGVVSCASPTTIAASGSAVLRTATVARPDQGKTQVQISWNGQQFGPPIATEADKWFFYFHDPAQVAALSPTHFRTQISSQRLTIYGANFLNVPSLVVYYGDNAFLCSPSALNSDCPADATHTRDVVTWISHFEVQVTLPRSDISTSVKIKVANNFQPNEVSSNSKSLSFSSDSCPGGCSGHGTCQLAGTSLACVCHNGYSGIGCSQGPDVVSLRPSETTTTGGYTITLLGRNFAPVWGTEAFSYKVLVGSVSVVCTLAGDVDGYESVVFTASQAVSTQIGVASLGVPVELTINNGEDYTANARLLKITGPPIVASISPNGANAAGGVTVTVTGSGFIDSPDLVIKFGDVNAASTIFVSSTRVVAVTAACGGTCAYNANVFVKVLAGGKEQVSTVTFRYLYAPSITTVFPPVGSVAGGTPVLIDASYKYVTNQFKCKFGTVVVAGEYIPASGGMTDRLKCVTPSVASPVVVNVQVALDGQSYSGVTGVTKFDYRAATKTTSVKPSLGPVGGGTRITITGTNFYSVVGATPFCKFGAVTTPMTVVSATQLNCTAPAGSGSQAFSVSLNGVDYDASRSYTYQFYTNPTLVGTTSDGLTPMGSPLVGGTRLTISGIGFVASADGIYASFRDVNSGQVVVSGPADIIDSAKIVCTTPPFPIHSTNIMVAVSLNGGQQFSAEAIDIFTFFRQPEFTELIPPLGPRLGETTVVAFGTGFINIGNGIARCRFGTTTVEAVFDDSASGEEPVLSCRSPPWPIAEWVPVEVALDGQVFTKRRTVLFQYYGEFDVASLVPAGGPKAGGTEITVAGVGFFMSGIYLNCFFGDGQLPCSIDVQYPCYKAVQAVYYSPTRATCVAPSMPDGGAVTTPYPVRLGLNGKFGQSCPNSDTSFQCAFKSGLQFTYYNDVFVARVLPNSGQVLGGTRITITGRNFRTDLTSRTRCIFTRCTSADVWISGNTVGQLKAGKSVCSGTIISAKADGVLSSTQLVCRSPLASTADSHFSMVDVSLNGGVVYQRLYGPTCTDGACPVMFFYYALPLISALVPQLGPETGLTVVTINGVGFMGQKTAATPTGFKNTVTRCKFGEKESSTTTTGVTTPVRFITDSSISCVAPPQPAFDERGCGDAPRPACMRVQVSLNGLDSDFTLPEMGSVYTYHRQPELTGAPQPSAGPTTGGTVITLTGKGFAPSGLLRCRFYVGNYQNDTVAVYLSATQVSCPVPRVPDEQLVDIAISLNSQDFSPYILPKLFKYFPAPKVFSAAPAGGPAESVGVAFVKGEGFLDTQHVKCRVGTVISVGIYINSTYIKCLIPQAQPKVYSTSVLSLGVITPEILPDDFVAQSVQSQPLEVSLDGQIFSSSKIAYTYYISPEVKVIAPSQGAKTAAAVVAVLSGSSFRNDFGGPYCRFGGVGTTRAVFLSDRTIMCAVPPVPLGKRVLVEISINGQEYESHKTAPYIFYGMAPALRSATLSSTYQEIKMMFDVNTNRGTLSGDFACSKVLSFAPSDLDLALTSAQRAALGNAPTAEAALQALFGFGAFCRFSNNQTLAIVTGARPTFTTANNVTLAPGKLMRGNELTYFSSGRVIVSPPASAMALQAVLTGPQQIGRCDPLVVDGAGSTGGAGRQLTFLWTLGASTVITDDNLTPSEKTVFLDSFKTRIQVFSGTAYDPLGVTCRNPLCLAANTTSTYANCYCTGIQVTAEDLPLGDFHIQLEVTNWLGVTSAASTIVVSKKLTAIPRVKIDAVEHDGVLKVKANAVLTLTAHAESSSCSGSTGQVLDFLWTVKDASSAAVPSAMASAAKTRSELSLSAFALTAARTYVATCTVNVRGSALLLSADSVRVSVVASVPQPVIAGGDRSYPAALALTLNGASSYHPDYAPTLASQPTLTYAWTCAGTSADGAGVACSAFGTGAAATLAVAANKMLPAAASYYTFTLSVRLGATGTASSASVKVYPKAANDGSPSVQVFGTDLSSPIVPNLRLVLSSSVSGTQTGVTYQWTTANGDVDLRQVQYLRSPNSRTSLLVVKAAILTPGMRYTVRLTATRAGTSGFGEVAFNVDDPPSGGTLDVSPTSGVSLTTLFTFAAPDWQEDADSLPIAYKFHYEQPTDKVVNRIAAYSSDFKITRTLPAGPAVDNSVLNIKLSVRNALGTETTVSACNLAVGACAVTVEAHSYSETLSEISSLVAGMQSLLDAGSAGAVLDLISQMLAALGAASATTSGRRRAARLLLATESERAANTVVRCDPSSGQARFIYQSIENGVTESTAASAASTLKQLYSAPSEISDDCTTVFTACLDLLIPYLALDWQAVPDIAITQDLSDAIGNSLEALSLMYDRAEVTSSLAATRMAAVLAHLENLLALSTHGSLTGESFLAVTSPNFKSNAARLAAPITSTRRSEEEHREDVQRQIAQLRRHSIARREFEAEALLAEEEHSLGEEIEEAVPGGGGRKLLASSTTTITAISLSLVQTTVQMPTMALPTAIAVVPCSTTPSGAAICQTGSVAASLMHFTQFFDPHFYDASASLVIASVLGFQLQAFGLPSFSPITMDSLPSIITLKFLLTTIPSPVRDARGHHKVAACVTWGGDLSSAAPPGGWSRARCTTGDVDGAQFIECFCTRSSYLAAVGGGAQHTVLNVPGDCSGTPYGTLSLDGCAVCGGDNSTCRGCDGMVASGLVLDGCLVCGGDNSSCAGCDGVPSSGKIFDECGLCGGDNMTCMGCDGIAVHQAVTARNPQVSPTSYDSCVSAAHPNGVCGGCDASCKGCDGETNSGRDYDKCQLCGPHFPASDGQYTVANKDQSCPLGMLDCGSGFVADACGECVAIDADEASRNQGCLGCDNVPRLFGRKVVDACSLCGGNGCSCKDCMDVVNGGAKRDKCGVCMGNNTCLDCFAVPHGPYVLDICGVCGGNNDTSQCSGCDGKIYRRPLTPPRFDSLFKCCPANLVGTGLYPERQLGQSCGDMCNATIGCDEKCSTKPKAVDRCGVCGGRGAASTGTCDCEGVPYGRSLIGCDGVCRDPPVVLDKCGVCGGTGEKNTGLCDCSGIPAGTPGASPSLLDSAMQCCYLSDMGCSSPARCWSGKTLDQCGTCGGDGGTCISVRPSPAARARPPLHLAALLASLLAALLLRSFEDRR